MLESTKLAKAQLLELDKNFENPIKGGESVTVQFNPETVKVSFANAIQTPSGTGDQSGTPARQFVGAGTTKLTVQLWFDVTALTDGENTIRSDDGELLDDVRKLTQKVVYFITPKNGGGPSAPAGKEKPLPPAVWVRGRKW